MFKICHKPHVTDIYIYFFSVFSGMWRLYGSEARSRVSLEGKYPREVITLTNWHC